MNSQSKIKSTTHFSLFFILLFLVLVSCLDEDNEDLDLQATFMDCKPELETIPDVQGTFLNMQGEDGVLFLANPVAGEDELIKYVNDIPEQILGLGSEVMDLEFDANGTLWFCSSGFPDIRGLYSYTQDGTLTRHTESPCSKLEIKGDFIYYITTEGTVTSDELRNIQCYHPAQDINAYCTDVLSNLFEDPIINFTRLDNGTFFALTDKAIVHTDGNQILDQFNNQHIPGSDFPVSGHTMLEADGNQVLFSHVVGDDWMLYKYDGNNWSMISLFDPNFFNPPGTNRLIYSLEQFEDHWYMASSWGIYKINIEEGMVAHFTTSNTPMENNHINYFYWENDKSMWISYFFSNRLDHIFCE